MSIAYVSKGRSIALCGLAALAAGAFGAKASADEGGVSFWLPGQFGSLIAVPNAPGWTATGLAYHTSVIGGGGTDFQIGGAIVAGLDGDASVMGCPRGPITVSGRDRAVRVIAHPIAPRAGSRTWSRPGACA